MFNNTYWEPSTWPKEAKGFGLTEAPRGALAHYVDIMQLPNGSSFDLVCISPGYERSALCLRSFFDRDAGIR